MKSRKRQHRLAPRESSLARIRVMVKRILKKYGYPLDLAAEATKLVLEQAEVLPAEWATK